MTPLARRAALGVGAATLVASTVVLGSVPVGAAPHHAAAASKAKFTTATLNGVTVVPHSSTAWAIGYHGSAKSTGWYALRRSGSHWTSVNVKVPAAGQLIGVAAGSAKSIWAVGVAEDSAGQVPLIDHSTGGSFKPMKVKFGTGSLAAVSASSASNAWAVGSAAGGGPLVARWNGKIWKLVTVDGNKVGVTFSSVSVSSPSNAWLLGLDGTTHIAAHWNGHKFTIIPVTISAGTSLTAIATSSAKNTWIVGTIYVTKGGVSRGQTFADHWNGAKWKQVAAPSPEYQTNPTAIAAFGSRAYIVGQGTPKTFTHGIVNTAFALEFTGGHWKTEPAAKPGKVSGLVSVAASSKLAVAVGSWNATPICQANSKPSQALAESLSGSSWHKESAPNLRRRTTHLHSTAELRYGPATPDVPAC